MCGRDQAGFFPSRADAGRSGAPRNRRFCFAVSLGFKGLGFRGLGV